MDGIRISDVAADVAAFLASDTTNVLVSVTADVLSAAAVASGVYLLREIGTANVKHTDFAKV